MHVPTQVMRRLDSAVVAGLGSVSVPGEIVRAKKINCYIILSNCVYIFAAGIWKTKTDTSFIVDEELLIWKYDQTATKLIFLTNS